MKLGTAHQSGPDRKLGQADRREVPGYRLLNRLGIDGPTGCEVWKAEGPGGFLVAVRFLKLDASSLAVDEQRLERLRLARHPNLVTTVGTWKIGRSLVLATELPDRTLWDDFLEVTSSGALGLPRDELLDHLSEAARGIDYLNGNGPIDHHALAPNLPHGAITPRTIQFVGGGIKVSDGDYGRVVATLTSNAGVSRPFRAGDYVAPECLDGIPSRHSDQYSLAVTYVHLRIGRLPFPGQESGQTASASTSRRLADLSALSETERPSIARALHSDPDGRWPSCRAFIEALRHDVEVSPVVEIDDPVRSRAFTLAFAGATGIATLSGLLFFASVPSPGRPMIKTAGASTVAPTTNLALDPKALSQSRSKIDGQSRTNPTPPDDTGKSAGLMEDVVPLSAPIASEVKIADESAQEPSVPSVRTDARVPVSVSSPSLIRLKTPHRVDVVLGSTEILQIGYEREGATGPVELSLEGLPAGLTTSPISSSVSGDESRAQSLQLVADLNTVEGEFQARVVARCGTIRTESEIRIVIRPSPALVARRRAKESANRGEQDQAISAYTESIALDPTDPLAFHGRGLALYGKKDYAAALADLDAALRLKPDSASTLNNRGLVRIALGNTTGAFLDFDASVRFNPHDPVVRYNRGRAYYEAGLNDKAFADFDETIRIDPTFAKAYKARADVLTRLGEIPRAAADYDEAIRLRPDDVFALNNRGLLRFGAGDYYRAIADFDEAIRLSPGYAAVRYNRGRVYASLGDASEALASFDQALRLDPTLIRAQQAREALIPPQTSIALIPSNPSIKPDASTTPRRRPFRQSSRSTSR